MQTVDFPRAFVAQQAGVALIARPHEPDADHRQRVVPHQSLDQPVEDGLERASLGHAESNRLEVPEVHGLEANELSEIRSRTFATCEIS